MAPESDTQTLPTAFLELPVRELLERYQPTSRFNEGEALHDQANTVTLALLSAGARLGQQQGWFLSGIFGDPGKDRISAAAHMLLPQLLTDAAERGEGVQDLLTTISRLEQTTPTQLSKLDSDQRQTLVQLLTATFSAAQKQIAGIHINGRLSGQDSAALTISGALSAAAPHTAASKLLFAVGAIAENEEQARIAAWQSLAQDGQGPFEPQQGFELLGAEKRDYGDTIAFSCARYNWDGQVGWKRLHPVAVAGISAKVRCAWPAETPIEQLAGAWSDYTNLVRALNQQRYQSSRETEGRAETSAPQEEVALAGDTAALLPGPIFTRS